MTPILIVVGLIVGSLVFAMRLVDWLLYGDIRRLEQAADWLIGKLDNRFFRGKRAGIESAHIDGSPHAAE